MRNAARQYTQEAIDTLVLVMRNRKPGEAAMAANSLLDRGWGRSTTTQQVDAEDKQRQQAIVDGERLAALSRRLAGKDELGAQRPN